MKGADRKELSSAEYFERARKLALKFKEKPHMPPFLEFDGGIRDGVNYKVLEGLRNPVNWSDAVRKANRRPRVYLDVRVDQSGNLEVRWASGPLKIYYRNDFNLLFGMGTEEWSSSSGRSRGELMYVPRFNDLVGGIMDMRHCIKRYCMPTQSALTS